MRITPRRLVGLTASLALTAALALGVVWAQRSSGPDEEGAGALTVTPTPTASPAASPTPLPPAAEGYTWFVTPPNDYGLPLYAVQVPTAFARTPSGPYYGNPEYFMPEGVNPYRGGPALIVQVASGAEPFDHPFRHVLPWQGGYLCAVLADGQYAGARYTWDLFRFTCPTEESAVCQADDTSTISCRSLDPMKPVTTFDGRTAEIRVGDWFFSIIIFQPSGSTAAEAAFRQAADSFILQ